MESGQTTVNDSGGGTCILPMSTGHLRRVVEIEQAIYGEPWTEESFRHELESNRFARMFVISTEDPAAGAPQVAGYICVWVVYEELRINNVAVDPVFRRRGLGEQMVRFALEFGDQQACLKAVLEVRPSNVAALALYEKLGFSLALRRPSYYSDTGEDALVMRRRIS